MLNFRKIASVLASTAMLSSTLALAAASNYPAPFVQSGNADVAVVYGSLPGAELDLASVTTIVANLQAKLSAQSSSSGSSTSTSTSGETYPLFTGSSKVYLNNSLNTVRSTLTDSELPTILADGKFSGNVDADYVQTIVLGANPSVTFAKQPTSDDDPTVGVALSTSTNNYVYNATVTFDRAVAFNNTDSEGEDIVLFGQKFTVGSATDDDELVLFKSSETKTLTLGGSSPSPSTKVTVDGKEFTVDLVSASDTDATIKVTDSAGKSDTKKINEASSKTVNGLEVAVNIADESDATNTAFAEITAGSQKVVLQNGAQVKIGSEEDTVDGTKVVFNSGTTNSIVGALTSITVQVAAKNSDEDAITAGNSLVDPVFGSFKLNFAGTSIGMNSSDRETIKIMPSGNDKMQVKLMDHRNNEKALVFANNESGLGVRALADGSRDRYHIVEQDALNRSSFVVVGNEDEGYIVELTKVTNSSSDYSGDAVEFTDMFDTSKKYTASITSEGAGTVTIGGKSYTLTYNGASTNSEESRTVRLNYPDSSSGQVIVFPTVETSKGAKLGLYEPVSINLTAHNGVAVSALLIPDGDGYTSISASAVGTANSSINGVTLASAVTGASTTFAVGPLVYNASVGRNSTVVTLALRDASNSTDIGLPGLVLFEEEDDNNIYNALIVKLSGGATSDSPLSVSDVETTWGGDSVYDEIQGESNNDLYESMDFWGTHITTDRSDSDQYTATISYPDEQVDALVYAGEVSSSVSSSGNGGSTKELGTIHVKDSEVASVASKNLIVVGGSCVNTLAKELLGGAGCGSSFEQKTGVGAGSFLIQSFSRTGGKVATLVAGYSAADTEAGAKVLTTQTVDTSAGKKYKGTGNTVAMVDTTSA